MKRRWFLIALCSLIFGFFGAVASAWLPAMVYALAAAPAATNRVVLSGYPGSRGWTTVDALAPGVIRARVIWLTRGSSDIGKELPDDVPRWAAHETGVNSSTTMGYGWPMVGLRWASKGAFGVGAISSVSISTSSTSGSLSARGTASFSVSGGSVTVGPSGSPGGTVGAQIRQSDSANQPPTPGTAPIPARDSASNSTSTIVLSARTPPTNSAPKSADILSPLRFSLFGVSVVLPVYPYWPGFLVNTLIYTALALLVIHLIARFRHRHRQHAGQCLTCGYDRRGLSVESPCPECGQPATNSVHTVATP